MKLRWLPRAVSDRTGIFDYLEERNPRAAVETDEIVRQLERLVARRAWAVPGG